jgi:hypothetical protein
MFTVESPSVLLQRPFPRNRHRQHQGIERRMVESFTDELAGRQ